MPMLIRAKVDFHKPDIAGLRGRGMTLVDMHIHTQYSDSYTKIPRLLQKADRVGVGFAITDHNEIKGAVEAYRKKDEQLVIPGIEVSCYERCHFLVYFYGINQLKDFYHNCVEPYKAGNPYSLTTIRTADLLEAAEDYRCITCAAHPFGPGFSGIHKSIRRRYLPESVVEKLDALEVMNGANLKKMNWRALYWAEDTKKPFVGGSDGHSLFELGKVLTYSDASTLKGFLDNIIEKRNFVIGKQIGLIAHMPSDSSMLRRHLRYIRPTLKMRYEVTLKPSVKYHVPRIRKKIEKRLEKAKTISVERVRDIKDRSLRRIDYKFERIKLK
jgi:predicted metal-dependent phosphoesterase TrpH